MADSSGLSKAFIPVLGILSLAAIVILQAGFVFLLLAMLPSVIAYYIDSDANKSLFKTIAACNLATALPSIAPMVDAGVHMQHYDLSKLMSNPMVWLFIYLGAAAGWCLIYLCRMISRFIMVLVYEYRIAALERMQKRLLAEWGDELIEKKPENNTAET